MYFDKITWSPCTHITTRTMFSAAIEFLGTHNLEDCLNEYIDGKVQGFIKSFEDDAPHLEVSETNLPIVKRRVTRTVYLGKKHILGVGDVTKGVITTDHWAVKLDSFWWDIPGASPLERGENIARHRHESVVDDMEIVAVVATTTRTDEEIEVFNKEWRIKHPYYNIVTHNCQCYSTDLSEFLCPGSSEKMGLTDVQSNIKVAREFTKGAVNAHSMVAPMLDSESKLDRAIGVAAIVGCGVISAYQERQRIG